jgi:glyoxylase I family protein
MTQRLVKQLAHVCIFSHDLARTEAFYRDVLGIPVVFRFMKEGREIGFYLDAGGRSNIEVFAKAEAAFAETNAINHLCLEVESMDAALAHIRALGVPVRGKSYGCDDTWQAWITDPDGVKIELFEYTEKSAQFVGGDRIATW